MLQWSIGRPFTHTVRRLCVIFFIRIILLQGRNVSMDTRLCTARLVTTKHCLLQESSGLTIMKGQLLVLLQWPAEGAARLLQNESRWKLHADYITSLLAHDCSLLSLCRCLGCKIMGLV